MRWDASSHERQRARMALRLVRRTPAAGGRSQIAFCARCGAPPDAPPPDAYPWRESRVCGHCGLGLVLKTPIALSSESRFLVLDGALRISAISRPAEELLGMSELPPTGQAVSELLAAVEDPKAFTALLAAAVLGASSPAVVRCRLSAKPELELDVLVGPCGPPPGALLVLEAPASQ